MPDRPSLPGGSAVSAVSEVLADLRVSVDADGQSVARAHVVGTGTHLSVTVDRPDVLAGDRSLVGHAAEVLAGAGLTASVEGPGGTVARLGAGISSRLGARATGSSHASLAPRGALLLLRTAVGPTAIGLLGAAVAVALTAVAAHGLRHHPRERRA